MDVEVDGVGKGRGRGRKGKTRGAWVGTGLGREDGGERDGRRMCGRGWGRWRGARREAHGWVANTAGLLRAKSAMREIGWLERTMEGLMLLHASWNGCQKPWCNRFMTVLEGFQN